MFISMNKAAGAASGLIARCVVSISFLSDFTCLRVAVDFSAYCYPAGLHGLGDSVFQFDNQKAIGQFGLLDHDMFSKAELADKGTAGDTPVQHISGIIGFRLFPAHG